MQKNICLYFLVLLTFTGCNMTTKPLVIGHRGAMGHETENTLASVQKALDLGVDMIEIDVFKIKSGEIVVFHDERLERLANAGGRIEEWYLGDLKKVVLEGNHSIPQLQDVLRLINNKVPLNIELKGKNTADRVNFIIQYYVEKQGWDLENFVISSFDWEELKDFRTKNPDIAIAVLTEENPLEAIPMAQELNAVAINPYYKSLTAEQVAKIHEAGFKVYTYTVNETEDLAKVTSLGVDGVFTNYPERAQ